MQKPARLFIEFYLRKLIFKGIFNIFQKMRKPVRIFTAFYLRKLIFKGIFNLKDILKKLEKIKKTIKDINVYQCFP